MSELLWTNDIAIRLVQEYRRRPELWDSSHEMYRVQTLKYERWSELAGLFDCDIADLRKKLNSLFASHRREKAKVRAGGRSTWFLYPHMSFLPNHLEAGAGAGEDQAASRAQPTTRRTVHRAPVREKPVPAHAHHDHHPDDDDDDDDEGDAYQDPVVVKEEPAVEYVRPAKHRGRQMMFKQRIHTKRPLKRRVVKEYVDVRGEAAGVVVSGGSSERRKDECDSFGEYIADSLRKHDERTQAMIKQAINNILFEQEMKKYTVKDQYIVITEADENPLILGADAADDQ